MFEWGAIWGNPDLSMGLVSTSDPPVTPSAPNGPSHGIMNKEYTYSSATTDPNGDQLYYMFSWGDGNSSEWIGPFTSGATAYSYHSWSALGSYPVKVKAKDSNGATSDWSEPVTMEIVLNDPPNIPTISGPGTGKPGTQYLFLFQTTDINADDVYYFVDWGDNSTSGWIGPYRSGSQASASHSWNQKGTYSIKIKAKDIIGDESDWKTLDVKMPTKIIFQLEPFLQQLFERFPNLFPILRYLVG
jgi:hypothetical protein